MTSTDGDKKFTIHKSDLNIIEGALFLTQGYTPELATEGVKQALAIIKEIREEQK